MDPAPTGPRPVPVAATERLNLVYHAIIGVAMGAIAPFTGSPGPAIAMGMVIGQAAVERAKGSDQRL